MDPVTIGVALAGAKKLLDISSNIKDVASSIEHILNLTEKAEKAEKSKKKNKNDTSIKSVIKDTVTERNNRTLLRNLAIDVDEKYGFGTWNAIEEERERRLVIEKENKIKATKVKKLKQKKAKELKNKILHWLAELGKLILVIALSGGAGYFIYINRCVDGVC